MPDKHSSTANKYPVGLLLGLGLFLLIMLLPAPEGLTEHARHVAAVAVLMAVWWVTEAIPIPVTALLPVVLFPVLGVVDGSQVTKAYANHLIFLFLGGFLIAIAIERWNLHRRIALHTIRVIGVTPNRIVLGFMLATAFLSMWISNTAATMMMATIGMAVLSRLHPGSGSGSGSTAEEEFPFGISLMLGIAYSASIGGVATLIGTPPNAILAAIVENTYGVSISFLQWMTFGLPLSLAMLLLCWLYLTRIAYRGESNEIAGGRDTIQREIQQLGNMQSGEKRVLAVFLLVALLWILRGLLDAEVLPYVRDSTIAMGGAVALFIIPSSRGPREFLLDWKSAVRIPWDILILFGGGFALAQGFSETGLTHYLAEQLAFLRHSPLVIAVAAVTCGIIFLTELTSNTATASLALPVAGALAVSMYIEPLALMTAVAVAASFAFMLPVATPPNAIVFGTRYVSIRQMAKTGFWLNLAGIAVITAFVVLLLPVVWGIDIGTNP